MSLRWTEKEDKTLTLKYPYEDLNILSEEIGRSTHSIMNRAFKLKLFRLPIHLRNMKRRYQSDYI